MDIPEIPELLIDNTDRNRTSPFAFTGNRFEFRAVGSEANCASAMITLNAAVAEALVDFKARVDKKIAEYEGRPEFGEQTGHTAKFHAIIDVLREDIKTCKPIRFNGNGYSDEWVEEATRRGLDVEKSCPIIFERYLDPASIKLFESMGVMTEKELVARNEVKWETYTKKIQIEARVLGDLSMNHIIPVATRYQSQLLQNVENMAEVFPKEKAAKLSARNLKIIEEIAERTSKIETQVEELVNARKVANKITDEHEKAIAYTTQWNRKWTPSATRSTNWSSSLMTVAGLCQNIANSFSSDKPISDFNSMEKPWGIRDGRPRANFTPLIRYERGAC